MQASRRNQAPPAHRKVLALGLDSPNHDLLLQWIAEGKLPHLYRLQQRAAAVTIASVKRDSNEHCWIPILTGRTRERWNHWLDRWDPQAYRFDEASIYDWIQAPVFYALGAQRRVVAFDLTAPIVKDVNGVQVAGWASELNECFPESDPPGLIHELVTRFGPDPKLADAFAITNELSQRQGVSHTLPSLYQPGVMEAYARNQVLSVERRTAACRHLLDREDWDLFIAQYSEVHTAGHLLWHLSQPHPLDVMRRGTDDPLLAVYQAVDASIGQLLQEVDEDVFVVFFTIDAMAPDCLENARAALLPEFLYRWNFPGKAALAPGIPGTPPPAPRLDYAQHWKHEVWRLRTECGEHELEAPAAQEARQDPMSWCPANWYAPLWPSMRAFALPTVADGCVRLNVRGREAQGIVGAGEFGSVCEEIADEVSRLVDPRSGKPVVREVVRVRESAYDDDPKKPPADLVVGFQDERPLDVVESALAGRIGPLPYFRSGAHHAHGVTFNNLMYLSGPGVTAGHSEQPAAPEDIPATILALLGVDLPAGFDGVPRFR